MSDEPTRGDDDIFVDERSQEKENETSQLVANAAGIGALPLGTQTKTPH